MKTVTEVGKQGILIGSINGPPDDVVNHFWIADPAIKENHDTVRVDIMTRVDGVLISQVVGKGLIIRHLVQVAQQCVSTEGYLATGT